MSRKAYRVAGFDDNGIIEGTDRWFYDGVDEAFDYAYHLSRRVLDYEDKAIVMRVVSNADDGETHIPIGTCTNNGKWENRNGEEWF